MQNVFTVIVLIVIAVTIIRAFFHKETIYEHERGLLFHKGRLKEILSPGQRWFLRIDRWVQKVDIRIRTISVPNQEILSSDNVTIKATLAAQYFISDPGIAITKVEKFQDAFYMLLQLSLREIVGGMKIDEFIAMRQNIGKSLFEKTEVKAREIGLTLKAVDIKDIMFPGELKKIFAQVVKAQKEGLAMLEKARGETAALRNLANAAKMLEGNPYLMQLRVLQSLDSGSGNTIVLGLPPEATTLPIGKKPQQNINTPPEAPNDTE